MGAKCCTSGAGDRALEATDDTAAAVSMDGDRALTCAPLSAKPLWQQEVEEQNQLDALQKEQQQQPQPEQQEGDGANFEGAALSRQQSMSAPPGIAADSEPAADSPANGDSDSTAATTPASTPPAEVKPKSGHAVHAQDKDRKPTAKKRAAQARTKKNSADEHPAAGAPASEPAEALAKPVGPMGAPMRGTLLHTFRVVIVSARGLRNADVEITGGGKSDPFCVCEIVGKPASRFQTKVIYDTLEPTWEYEAEISGFAEHDTLQFGVWDKDTFTQNDSLGRATLDKKKLLPTGFQGDLRLTSTSDTAQHYESFITVRVELVKSEAGSAGERRPSVRIISEGGSPYSAPKIGGAPKMTITIVGARGLRNADWLPGTGMSDPYCVCEVPGKVNSRIQTPVVKDKLAPQWNHTAEVVDWHPGDSLAFAVFDKDVGKWDDLLGKASLKNSQLSAAGFNGELQLWDKGKKTNAFLKVKVALGALKPPPPSTPEGQEVVEKHEKPAPSSNMMSMPMLPGDLLHVLKVTIISAKGLRNADVDITGQGKSDPFCVCEIPGKAGSKFQTPVIMDTLDPKWNHEVEIRGIAPRDSFKFSVWDKDTFTADDLLGVAVLPKEKIFPMGFHGELRLQHSEDSAKQVDAGNIHIKVEVVRSYVAGADPKAAGVSVRKLSTGEASVTEAARGSYRLMVTLVSARGLRNADHAPGAGKSDPYCVCEVPGKERSRITSPVVPNRLDPRWDYKAQVLDYQVGDSLAFAVMDKDVGKWDDLLGRACLKKDQIYPDGFDGELRLANAGKGIEAYLKVKVAVLMGVCSEEKEKVTAEAVQKKLKADKAPAKAGDAKAGGAKDEDPAAVKLDESTAKFFEAAKKGDSQTVKKLLSEGVSLTAVNAEGLTALHVCARAGKKDVVEALLLQKGKRKLLNVKTQEDRSTAVHLATAGGFKEIVFMLVKEGANFEAKNKAGKMPADLAKGELAKWLRCDDPAGTEPPWRK